MNKRYEALYLHPDFCDGFYDNENKRYLKNEEINEMLNQNLSSDEIEEILNRRINENVIKIEDKKVMSNLKMVFEGICLVVMGFFAIVWYFVKIISCIMIAGLISTKLGLSNYYWWFSSIIIVCILINILFYKNNNNPYGELVNQFKNKYEDDSDRTLEE